MTELKKQILELKEKGLSHREIVKELGCSSSTVSYHLNDEVKAKAILRKQKNEKLKRQKKVQQYKEKEISVKEYQCDWKAAEMYCIAKMIELGYECYIPVNYGAEADFIALKEKEVIRCQVKSTGVKDNDEKITINGIGIQSHKQGVRDKPYENIDIILVYDGNNIYKIKYDEIGMNITLRYKMAKDNQLKGINWAKDYII